MNANIAVDDILLQSERQTDPKIAEYLHHLASQIHHAQKFKFQSVPFELMDINDPEVKKELQRNNQTIPENLKETIMFPELTDDEKSWFSQDLIPLPAPVVWYEFSVPKVGPLKDYKEHSVPGVLIMKTEKGWMTIGMYIQNRNYVMLHNFRLEWTATKEGLKYDSYVAPHTDSYADHDRHQRHSEIVLQGLFFYLTLMILSKSTKISVLEPSAKVNKKREKAGKRPIDSYRIVTIINRDLIKSNGGEGVPKRLHWCRSHLRHYENKTPNSTWVEDMEYKDRKGWWCTVVAGHFRGDRDLGTITHDYIVT